LIQSWVTDLVWLDEKSYDPSTGAGAVGVEFGGSAVTSPCPAGANITIAAARNYSEWLVGANKELQWSDLYYRGYYELAISHESVVAQYFGMPTVVNRNPHEISLANFTVLAGANKLSRPIAGGQVAAGALKVGKTVEANISKNSLSSEEYPPLTF
jgi:alkaline phosphatase D